MIEAVEKVRADAVGCELAEVVLLNGTIFKNAKIRKVDDSSISFFHSTGISTVQVEQVPSDLVEKFDMGSRSLVVQLEQLEASLGNAPLKPESVENPKLLAVRKRLAQLEIQNQQYDHPQGQAGGRSAQLRHSDQNGRNQRRGYIQHKDDA